MNSPNTERALKAWQTRKGKNILASCMEPKIPIEKPTAWEKKELKELNGIELKNLAKGNGKKASKNLAKQSKESQLISIMLNSGVGLK